MRTKLIILFVFIVGLLTAQTVYIDPSINDPAEDGTITHPYNSWTDFTFTDHYTYLQKKSTIYYGAVNVNVKHDIYIGTYGSGSKPILQKIGGNAPTYLTSRSQRIEIDGYEIVGLPGRGSDPVEVGGHWSSSIIQEDIIIRNCDIHQGYNGIRSFPALPAPNSVEGLEVYNCNIYDIEEDGIFIVNVDDVIIEGCNIWDFNLAWFKKWDGVHDVPAPGDGIQLTGVDVGDGLGTCRNWLIKNNTVDKRGMAGKFCIIVGNDHHEIGYDGALIGNTIYMGKDTLPRYPGDSPGGSGAYISGTWMDGDLSQEVIIAYNRFIGRGQPDPGDGGQPALVAVYMAKCDVFYNVFDSCAAGAYVQDNTISNFYNNTVIGDVTGASIIDIASKLTTNVYNNLGAANTSGDPFRALTGGVSVVNQGNNITYKGVGSGYDSYLGIEDWEGSDFHLVTGSIAIDAGMNSGYDYDFDSVPVPQNGLYDIGSYEYNSGVPPVGDPPVANFSANDVSAYIGQTITFTDLSTENPTSWDWTFDPATITYVGGTSSTSQNPQVQFTANGTYNVSLEATNAEGSDTETKTGYIVVAAVVGNANFSASSVVTGINTQIDFTDLSTSPLTWLWTFNPATVTYLNETTNASQNPDVEFDAIGLYDVTLYITVLGGNDTEIKLDYINVLAAPVANFSASSTVPYIGDIVQFTDLSTERPTSWLWTFSPTSVTYENGTSNASQNPHVSFDAAGLYTVTLRATNAYGNDSEVKADYISAQIVFTNPPVADFAASDRAINATQTVTFYNLTTLESPMRGLEDFTYVWVFEGGTPSTSTETNPIITYNTTGQYDVTLTSTNSDGNDTETKLNYITVEQENTPDRGDVLMNGTNIILDGSGNPIGY